MPVGKFGNTTGLTACYGCAAGDVALPVLLTVLLLLLNRDMPIVCIETVATCMVALLNDDAQASTRLRLAPSPTTLASIVLPARTAQGLSW